VFASRRILVFSIIALQCRESGAQCAHTRASTEERRVLTAYEPAAIDPFTLHRKKKRNELRIMAQHFYPGPFAATLN
jgi:hypothetical protein